MALANGDNLHKAAVHSFFPECVRFMWDQSLRDMFDHGGPVMWPLLAASVIAVAVLLDRIVVFAWSWQRVESVTARLRPLLLARKWQEAEASCVRSAPFTNLARVYLQYREQPKEIRDDVLRREGALTLASLDRRLRWFAVLAQVGTLLGLLGTFYFMIYRFRPEATVGGQLRQAEFFVAIWESFLSTMFGLLIAIPCTAAYHIFEGRTDNVARDMSVLVSFMDEWVREGDNGPTATNHEEIEAMGPTSQRSAPRRMT